MFTPAPAFRTSLWAILPVAILAIPAWSLADEQVKDLRQASIEELMNIEITSASRKEQRSADVAAAVFVITQEDIRRSGLTTIPDVLRLAPGVDVAQINANKWAVSVRGFNGLYANKLLLLIDGRSVYNRLFSGVLWDAEDLLLDDIDRIEVIRGPGAAMWGANAANGVINIVTKAAADTQGGLVRVEAGRAGAQGAVRYGGALGSARARVFVQWDRQNQSLFAPGIGAGDDADALTTGFRGDWSGASDTVMLEGGLTAGRTHALWLNVDRATAGQRPIVPTASDSWGGHVLDRWTHTRANGASLQIQSFFDVADRWEPIGDYHRRAVDIDTQYHTAVGERQDLVAGSEFRFINEGFNGSPGHLLTPADDSSSLLTGFLQDEISLFAHRLVVTIGSQVQWDSFAGAGVQPTARVMWTLHPHQRLWAAVSRALRTPALVDRGIRVEMPATVNATGLPVLVTVLGNPAAKTENFQDTEVGYRVEIGSKVSVDVTGFVGRYADLQTQELSPPVVTLAPTPQVLIAAQFGNLLAADTRGLEVAGHWTPLPAWRLDASCTTFDLTPHLSAASLDPDAPYEDGSAPRTQWQLRSTVSASSRATLSAGLFHAGSLREFEIPAYTRVDVNAEWRFSRQLSLMVIGQNLFDAAHPEFSGLKSLLVATQVPRSGSLRLTWTF